MDPYYEQPLQASHDDTPKASFWRKLGGGSLSISIIVHAVLLAVGVFWIFQIIPAGKPEDVDFMPNGGGGGQPGAKVDVNMKKRATMTTMNAPRLAAKGAASTFTLPDPEASTAMTSVGSLSSGGMSGGLGGSGSGGGRGDGHGTGFGSGSGPGLGGGASGMNPFGMINPNANALVGVFYDTKQDPKRKPTDMTPEKLRDVIKDFTHGWNERLLEGKYYQASQKLYQNKVYIPVMSANGAPKAFNCEKEVQPSRWIVIYRGNVIAPKSGKFRFVGAGDDVLVVRFNKRNVFDHGYTQGVSGLYVPGKVGVLNGTTEDRAVEKIVREGPMKIPVTFYKYDTTQNWNNSLGGLACGPEFEVTAGSTYPIEILISEVPGGLFGAALMIEEVGATYKKASTGSPILPIFRLDNSEPADTKSDNAPPYDPTGPIWKIAGGAGKRDI